MTEVSVVTLFIAAQQICSQNYANTSNWFLVQQQKRGGEKNQKQVILMFASWGRNVFSPAWNKALLLFFLAFCFFLKQNNRHELVKQSVIIDCILLLFYTPLIRTLILDLKIHVLIPPPPGLNLNGIAKE